VDTRKMEAETGKGPCAVQDTVEKVRYTE
jgi:hypothetical protein